MRRLIEAMALIKNKLHYVRMNVDVRSDLVWWDQFLVEWNGVGVSVKCLGIPELIDFGS